MVSLTINEAKTLEFLIRNFSKEFNINRLAKELKLSPGGMFKILKKLAKYDFLIEKKLGNNSFYKINYDSEDSLDALKFVLTEKDATPYVKVWIKDLEVLKEKTKLAILFGSVLTKGKEAKDIDVLLVFEKENIKEIEKQIDSINKIKSKKIHAIYQTSPDMASNISKGDPAILEEIRTGIILWGRDYLIGAIKNGQNR